jgi:hypothetical protein
MKTFKLIFFGVSALCCSLGFFLPNPQPHFWWHYIPVFDAVFGFIGCVVIILASKALGHFWVQKKEDYYD